MPKRFKKGKATKISMPVKVKGIDKENYTLTMVASTQDVDRHNDTVVQAGWDLMPFIKNPVILNSHKHNDATEVIARAENIRIEGKGKRSKLIMDWVFAVDENPKAKIIFDLYAGKFLHASSVGFIPRKFAENKDGTRDWYTIEEAELLEVSAVSVPANAMALAKSKGVDVEGLDDEDITEDEQPEESEAEPEVETTDEQEEVEEPEVEIDPEEQEPEVPEENMELSCECGEVVTKLVGEEVITMYKCMNSPQLKCDACKNKEEAPAQTIKTVSHTTKVLNAIHSIEDERMAGLKAARGTIDLLLSENGLKTLSEENKEKVTKRKINQVIRKLVKIK